MGGRIALGVLLVLAACKSRSDSADKATGAQPVATMPAPPGSAAGSGSAASAGSAATKPVTPTPVAQDGVRPADTKVGGDTVAVRPDPQPVPAIAADSKRAPPAEPAIATPAMPDSIAMQPARAADEAKGPPGFRPEPPITPKEKAPSGTIKITAVDSPDTSTLTVDDVTQKIKAAYLPGLKRCYVKLLAIDATAKGRVDIGFKVTSTGRPDGPKVTAFAPTLAACMKTGVAAWRFPVPTDIRTRNPMLVHFRVSLALTPD